MIDESGEDYLFPETCFMTIDLPALDRPRSRCSQLTRSGLADNFRARLDCYVLAGTIHPSNANIRQ